MSRASEVVMLETWLADSRREQTRRIRRHKMHARDIRGIVIDHLGLSALAFAAVVSALTFVVTLALIGVFSGQRDGAESAAPVASGAESQAARPAVVVGPAASQARTVSPAALPELWIYEEPALHTVVAPRAITQTERDLWLLDEVTMQRSYIGPLAFTQAERDLWLLEEPNMHHLAPPEGRSLDWIWTDPHIFDEPNLHHLVPPHATR
jgi:hypothetical protein